jgi:hypothetical protein|tara:strand:- start:26362 stop:26751 length:390 start_codon:yes stop_codon:yes gene_type:complete
MIKNTTQAVRYSYAENFDRIFGGKPPESGAFTQDRTSGRLVPRQDYPSVDVNAPMVMKPLKDFVSPITREVISSRSQLAQHNKKHGVTNSADYSGGYIENRAKERNAAGEKYLKDTRITDIHAAIAKHS